MLKLCKEAGIEKLTDVLAPLEAALAREDEALNRSREACRIPYRKRARKGSLYSLFRARLFASRKMPESDFLALPEVIYSEKVTFLLRKLVGSKKMVPKE